MVKFLEETQFPQHLTGFRTFDVSRATKWQVTQIFVKLNFISYSTYIGVIVVSRVAAGKEMTLLLISP